MSSPEAIENIEDMSEEEGMSGWVEFPSTTDYSSSEGMMNARSQMPRRRNPFPSTMDEGNTGGGQSNDMEPVVQDSSSEDVFNGVDETIQTEDTVWMSLMYRRRNALAHTMAEEDTGDGQDDDDDDDTGDEDDGHVEEDLLTLATNGNIRSQPQETTPGVGATVAGADRQQGGMIYSSPIIPSAKRKASSPRPDPSPKKTRDSICSQDDSADCCPICFEPWSNSGAHILTALKCGHLFGKNCIERWIKNAKKCPQCNAKARKVDVRVLYAKNLKAVDTTELTEAVSRYEMERELRRKKEMELAKALMQYQMAMTEVNRLKSQIEDLKHKEVVSSLPDSVQDAISFSSSSHTAKKFSQIKNILMSSNGNCRVMDYHPASMSLAISQPSPHANFMTGFGLKKFSVADMKSHQFNILHTKAIKDVKFSSCSNIVLTASQDETLKITNWDSNCHVHTYSPQRPVWSCCWDSTDSNKMYAGLSNGLIHCYDLRFTSDVTGTISNPVSRCPVVTMYHLPPKDDPCSPGGLLVQTLEGVTFWQNHHGSEYTPYILPLSPGRCVGLQYCDELRQCLVTYRPGRSYPTTTHILCQLAFGSGEISEVTTDVVETFHGGQTHKMLTRNALLSSPSMGSLVCTGDEANNRVNIYEGKSKGRLLQSLPCSGAALDILPIAIDGTNFLATLTDKYLKLYEQK